MVAASEPLVRVPLAGATVPPVAVSVTVPVGAGGFAPLDVPVTNTVKVPVWFPARVAGPLLIATFDEPEFATVNVPELVLEPV
jgi:hypothetical protein